MARKTTTKTPKGTKVEEEQTQSRSSLFEYLRFGESYTSLILGIIVVIISTVLLLSFVHNKNTAKDDTPQLLSQKDIALPSNVVISGEPSKAMATTAPVKVPTTAPKKAVVMAPTAKPSPTHAVTPTPVKEAAKGNTTPGKGEYVVVAGDNLWAISEKTYKSGYNWVDIARANNLSNPGKISAGQKLKLPKVDQKIATVMPTQKVTNPVVTAPKNGVVNNDKIIGTTYTTMRGDTLWNISVRAYGDGFQWQKIASANNLSNPRLIHSGNTLKIPRG
jgi:nucleoid-associated protein YgaU